MHYSILEDWVDKGRTETLPDEMVEYLEQLTMVNQLWNSQNSPNKILQKLQASYPELNAKTARSRMDDAFTWFYLDDQVKKDAYRNMLFDKMLKLVDATIISATSPEDYDRASKILLRAYRVKQLDKDEEESIPEEAFKKPIKIYSLDTSEFEDLPEAPDRKLLAEYIDQMNVTEAQALRIKQDAGIEPKQLFDHEDSKERRQES
ncbi:hypothetical protein [Allomuricauda sp. ARW1Y1]|jgi:hypothetical protein|uniref:hypothetical protein n=1 Tax=Allomuricauda sp. ARW1Y1 TaxID=2663843 RepID=UPI0015CAE439|nr:hypothetical protein [Muricauda sp. ARW1Y1]NYJ27514.1 hypothetical protein [Muricauda sp. ARW1Y1]